MDGLDEDAFDEMLRAADAPIGRRPGDERSTWVIVDRTPDGAYFPAIVCGDRTWPLTDAHAYAAALLRVVEDACHDAAVVRLLRERMHMDEQAAVWFVTELRKDRPPYDVAPTAPLVFLPMVGHRDGLPWVTLELDGRRLGRWTPAAARGHAAHVLGAPHAADLDAALVRQLRVGFELSAEPAARVVNDLADFRDDHHDGRRVT